VTVSIDPSARAEAYSAKKQYRETLEARKLLMFSNTIRTGLRKILFTEKPLSLPFSDKGSDIHQIVAFSDIRKDLNQFKQAFINTRLRTDLPLAARDGFRSFSTIHKGAGPGGVWGRRV